jgi:hypothetical protein
MTTLERASLDACASALRKYGFKARRRGLFLQPRTDEKATGWLGLNLATWGLPSKLQINPVVGVRHVPLEEALVELAGWKAPIAAVSRPLGYLMPQNTFVQWDFPVHSDIAAIAEDLANNVATFGQTFIDKWSNWGTFSSHIAESGFLLDQERYFLLPLVAAINGDRQRAEDLVRQEVNRVGNASDVYSEGYRKFAERFSARPF